MRKLTLESASPWMVSEPYRTGKCLTVVLPARSQTTDVQVIKLYPPTNSVTLLVEKLGSSSDIPPHAILKLADRRFGNAQEEFLDEPAWPWTTDIEREFQAGLHAYIQMHDQPPDLSQDEDDEPTWMRELRHWNEFNFVHRQKKKAYSYLKEAQLRGYVPQVHPSLDHIDGLLMEYIPGQTMGELQPGIDLSYEEAEKISQKVLTLGRRLRHYGVAYHDIHLNNIILCAPSNDPVVLIDWRRADVRYSHISAEQNWENRYLVHDFELDVRTILQRDGLWHRYSTPISDESREEQARNSRWYLTNRSVANRPTHELERFYYRDHSVPDENVGLQWKVKPNVKTRPTLELFEPLPEK
ncbi:hypothetical protein J132_10607 [Termitomyces sp. J132]|nr:hypothetical protein J132_10607 [Termitomyces sp. J132]